MLLPTKNLRLKGIPAKLQRKFVGPFTVLEIIGQQAYKLSLPDDWKIHPVFHVSLLKDWRTANLQEDQPIPTDVPEVEDPYYEIKRILHWRKIKRNRKILKEYLILWKGYPVEEASWVQASQFSCPDQLKDYLKEENPEEEKV